MFFFTQNPERNLPDFLLLLCIILFTGSGLQIQKGASKISWALRSSVWQIAAGFPVFILRV
jgi:hypothetical protein